MTVPRSSVFLFDVSEDDNLTLPLEKQHLDVIGVQIPSAFTGTSIGLQGSLDGTTYCPIYWEGTILAITVAASRLVMFAERYTSGIPWLKMTSNGSEAADRTVIPVFWDFTK